MKRFLDCLFVALIACLLSLVFILPAGAYIDPGTGSAIFQAAIAGALAVAVGVKVYWQKIRAFFSSSKDHDKQSDDENPA